MECAIGPVLLAAVWTCVCVCACHNLMLLGTALKVLGYMPRSRRGCVCTRACVCARVQYKRALAKPHMSSNSLQNLINRAYYMPNLHISLCFKLEQDMDQNCLQSALTELRGNFKCRVMFDWLIIIELHHDNKALIV